MFIVSRLSNKSPIMKQVSSKRYSVPRLIKLSVNFLFSIYEFVRIYRCAREREREEMSFCRDSIDFVPEIQLLCSRQRWRIFSADKKNSISSIALRNRNRMFVVEISRRSKVKSRETKTAFRLRIEDNGISIPLNLTFNRQKIQFSLLFL